MGKTFIAMENPTSWVGSKHLNTPRNKPVPTVRTAKLAAQKHARQKAKEYEERSEILAKAEIATYSKATDQDHAVVLQYQEKNDATTFLAISGSLPSMMKRLRDHAEAQRVKFDTLVFVGHGDVGSMSVGMGRIGINTTSHKGAVFARRIQQSEREISVENKASWKPTFESIKDYVEPRSDGHLHVFLIGCSTGEGITGNVKHAYLTQYLAEKLCSLYDIPVAVYGLSNTITAEHTREVLQNLDEIRDAHTTYTFDDGIDLICSVAT